MIAQKEIAKALGISAVTVSRALRNHPDLARGTRERILEKARELGYPLQAPGGEKKAVKRLGVLLYEKNIETGGEFWTSAEEIPRRILSGIQREAQKRQIEILFEIPDQEEPPMMVRNRTTDGIILMGRYSPEVLAHLRGIPALSVSNYIVNDWLPRVVADNFRGMNQVTEHLIALGHRKILFLGAEEGGWSELHRERARGYLLAMYSHGLTPEVIHCPSWRLEGEIEKILQFPAVAASSDSVAMPLQDQLRERGLVLPRDCRIAAFDGNFRSAERKLTTYVPDWNLMGKMAVDFLNYPPSEALPVNGVEIVVPGHLVVRESSTGI